MNLKLATAIANHPHVRKFRAAVQIMHGRMIASYGYDFAEPMPLHEGGFEDHSGVGINRWTQLDRDRYDSLMRGYTMTRERIRQSLVSA